MSFSAERCPMAFWTVVIFASAGLTGCAGLAPQPLVGMDRDLVEPESVEPVGVAYPLPRSKLRFALVWKPATAQFAVEIPNKPMIEPDPAHQYVLDENSSPASVDRVEISVDGNGFLSQITTKFDDQLDEAVVEAARSFGAITGLEGGRIQQDDEVLLAQFLVDPEDDAAFAAMERAMNREVFRVSESEASFCRSLSPEIQHAVNVSAQCSVYAALVTAKTQTIRSADATQSTDRQRYKGAGYVAFSITRPPTLRSIAPPDCKRVLCYRPRQPYRIEVRVGDGAEATQIIAMPNRAPVLALNIDRALFVQKDITINFADGFLTNVEVAKPSELVEAAALPLEILKALLDGPAQVLGFRKDASDAELKLLKAEAALKKEQAKKAGRENELAKARDAAATKQASSIGVTGASD